MNELIRHIFSKKYYMIYTDFNGKNISVKCKSQNDLDELKKTFNDLDIELIDCGPISYWFMKHSMPTLAMSSLWR